MPETLLQNLALPVNGDTLASAGRLLKRSQQFESCKFAMHRCSVADLERLQELICSVGWQVARSDIEVILQYGELYTISYGEKFISSAGWIEHGNGIAWIVLVTTRPEWRGCSAATLMMYKALESSRHYPKRLLDASNMGESVYRRIGFKDCGQVHFYEFMPETPGLDAPVYSWQDMDSDHFDLPGTLPGDPAWNILYKRNPELCKVLIKDNRIAAWFIGREKTTHIHLGPIYAETAEMASDALCFMRQMHPERKLTVDVFTSGKELVDFLQKANGAYHHSHARMYYAQDFVPVAAENIRTSSGPDFG